MSKLDQPLAEVSADVEMSENGGVVAVHETVPAEDTVGAMEIATVEIEPIPEDTKLAKRIGFTSYLQSPVVTLRVVSGEETISLTAHQALLMRSPYFTQCFANFSDDDTAHLIHMTEDLDTVGCFLEYLYTGDYFPRKLSAHAHQLESDPNIPEVDETGLQLLKHARVYTLAGKLQLPQLQALASSKIHCVNSTAKGEIAYARYVYAHTEPDDKVVRSPVAKFWATRSHALRAEAEKEFQALCLEFPQFSYDVLTRVLDEKLKREREDKPHSSLGSARKRSRNSGL